MLDLDHLEVAHAVATPTPWSLAQPWGGYCRINSCDGQAVVYTTTAECPKPQENHDLIIAAVNALPTLIAELRELRAYRAEVEYSAPIVQALLDSGEAAESKVAQLEERLKALTNWRPIETAPKDGTRFLAYTVHGGFEIGEWYQLTGTKYVEAPDGRFDKVEEVWDEAWNCNRFDHWLPLIAGPEVEVDAR